MAQMVFCKENLKAIKKNEKEVLILWAEYQKIKGQALEVFLDKVKKIIEKEGMNYDKSINCR